MVSPDNKSPLDLQRARVITVEALRRFRSLDLTRQARVVAAATIVLAAFAGLLWYATRTEWRTLYAGAEPDDARQIAQELNAAQIPFDLSPDGGSIRVPAQMIDKARLVSTAKGGPKTGRMGFELFDKPNWMGSEFDEQVNYQRALEGELEHTVEALGAVQSARVHLVLPHDSLFSAQQHDAKASVVLRLRHRVLSEDQAEAISNLIACAVDGLRPENVVLVDADGRGILGRHGGDAAQDSHERQLAAKIVDTLEAAAGTGNVRASVNVDYDSGSFDETDDTYDPNQTVTLAMQRTEQISARPIASGVPGTASNAPDGKPPLYPASSESQQNSKQESGTYGVSKKVRHIIQPSGRIRRLTAAVLINYRRVPQGTQTVWQSRPPEEMKRLSELAESAIGFDTGRGDQVTVQEIAFDNNLEPLPSSMTRRLTLLAGRSWGLLRYATILIVLTAFIIFAVRPAMRSLTAVPAEIRPRSADPKGASAPQATDEPGLEQLATEQRRQRAQNVFDQVAEHVRREPAQSTRLIESWIRTE